MSVPDHPPAATFRDAPAAFPVATLVDIDIRHELNARTRRLPDSKSERDAFALLAAEMAADPRRMLQKLADVALDLCGAHTAGIGVLNGDVVRWEAIAGVFTSARGITLPRNASPCGVCIERSSTQLMHLPDRCFPALFAEPRFVEALLVPFYDHGTAVGTLWVVSHSSERRFDIEDERILHVLAKFASAGQRLWPSGLAVGDANRKHDAVLAILGHELRNPLAAITAATAVLERRAVDQEHVLRVLEVITRQTQHMARLADDLLDAGRISSGKMHLDVMPLNLRSLVTEVLETIQPRIERRGLRLAVNLGDVDVWVSGDPMRLTQVFTNLLDNAGKNTPSGGRVSLDAISDGREVSISVTDSGVGIPADQLQRIFEPFAQLSVKNDSGGLGLGLSLVRSLTELHGGTVTVSSEGWERGSCFTVRLPVIGNSQPRSAR